MTNIYIPANLPVRDWRESILAYLGLKERQLNKTTLELDPSNGDLLDLQRLSRTGVSFYNAALRARLEAQEAGRRETRVTQATKIEQICEQANIGLDALPPSVMLNLLSALDAAIFGTQDRRSRDRQRFWPLCWAAGDVRPLWSKLVLVGLPSLRLPLPWVYAGQGKVVQVAISQNWTSGQFGARIEWSPVSFVRPVPMSSSLLQSVIGVMGRRW